MATSYGSNENNLKDSVASLIFKELAKEFRALFGHKYDIKAHPVTPSTAVLVFKNKLSKITFNMSAGDLDTLLVILKILAIPNAKNWLINQTLNDSVNTSHYVGSKYIISVSIMLGNQLSDTKSPSPIGIDLAHPDSIREIKEWIMEVVHDQQ